MIFTDDERIEALQRGEWPSGVPRADVPALRDAVHALDAAAALEDTLYAGQRTLRLIGRRRRRYYVDVGSAYWIFFEWRVHDAIRVRLVRLRRTTLGTAFRR
jgi:hypothetical protein